MIALVLLLLLFFSLPSQLILEKRRIAGRNCAFKVIDVGRQAGRASAGARAEHVGVGGLEEVDVVLHGTIGGVTLLQSVLEIRNFGRKSTFDVLFFPLRLTSLRFGMTQLSLQLKNLREKSAVISLKKCLRRPAYENVTSSWLFIVKGIHRYVIANSFALL